MTIDLLLREHRNIDLLLTFLQRELEVFEHGTRPDYEVIRAILSYFEVYPAMYHHPQEDLIFSKLETRDPDAIVGNLAHEHQEVVDRLHHAVQAIDGSSRIVNSFGKTSAIPYATLSYASGTT
ncbi:MULTISPECIES: hemerythrin domain-containing protein [Bradyrhizobium]|uniref:Hemerythrin domain-containing protein n=2 Tax=Bradyrhizobium TaxID=374 RepID=A0ACD3V2C4_9BRAD|nr:MULTISPECIES: hemerythrin domain-containing protein [Bradyrhizobium]UFX44289.1 hemerythrin domain-containing protein [Bradyrhizobium sp. 41S5]UGA44315.1 hemerythrin domain-containing protein [Bradyrhizobium quebecense]UGY00540.1 hemerythrin domain-containing protein [Bradyrhizobium quebecense]UPT88745.1 hemerythrin domain-containing protein [Bradyrhizobium barranii subsp. apii]UPT97327.1 hemerythrin domain-containing protein [Bradyrhizobium barranii subsp. apii]